METPDLLDQESLRFRRRAVPTSLSTKGHQRFYPRDTYANQPVSSAATEFSDTDFEASDSDEESLRQSIQSVSIVWMWNMEGTISNIAIARLRQQHYSLYPGASNTGRCFEAPNIHSC